MTGVSGRSEFDNEWLCPYCLALTGPEDQYCPACRHPLVLYERKGGKRSVWLWRGIFVQYAVAIYLIAFGAGAMTLVVKFNGVSDPVPFLPLYLGLASGQPADLDRLVLEVFPRWVFWSIVGATLYSIFLMIVLTIRLRMGHLLYMLNAGIVFALGGLTLYLFRESMLVAIICLVVMSIGIAQLFIALKITPDFSYRSRRLKLVPDQGVKDHTNFFLSGRDYAKEGLWGLAALHLRRAVVARPQNAQYRLALAMAYLNVKRYKLADEMVAEAERLAPGNPKVAELRRFLQKQKTVTSDLANKH